MVKTNVAKFLVWNYEKTLIIILELSTLKKK